MDGTKTPPGEHPKNDDLLSLAKANVIGSSGEALGVIKPEGRAHPPSDAEVGHEARPPST